MSSATRGSVGGMVKGGNYDSISDAIIHDHKELKDFYGQYKDHAGDLDAQTRWANQFRWELARHSLGEEIVVYPQFEKYLPDGKQMADSDRREHQTIKELLYKLEQLSPADSEHAPTFKELMDNLTHHIQDEEEKDLPKFEKAISRDDSKSFATSFTRTKYFVPTHSHPGAPDKPPYETVAGLLMHPIDKLRDMFSKFPE